MTGDIQFLTFEDVCDEHTSQLAAHGGLEGIRDENVVRSSLDQAQWAIRFGGDIADAAAALLYHLAVNQGFVDGNKRTALGCAVNFLRINGYDLRFHLDTDPASLTLAVANNELTKEELAELLASKLVPCE